MRFFWLVVALAVAAVALLALPAFGQTEAAPGYPWYAVDAEKKVTVNLYLFWSSTCPHCPPALEFAADLQKRRPGIKVQTFEITGTPANRDLYWQMAGNLKRPVGPTPAFVYCKHLHNGFLSYELTGKQIESDLVRWYDTLQKHYAPKKTGAAAPAFTRLLVALVEPDVPDLPEPPDLPPAEEHLEVPVWGRVDTEGLSLPAFTAVIAACDSLNPCAFFVLLLLLSVMVHGHSRPRMAFVGGMFVFASAAMYFLFMTAWLNLFVLIGHLRLITVTAGALAVLAAVINVKDFFWFKHGPSLSIPDSARPKLTRRMTQIVASSRPATLVVGTIALAFTANLYELLCTSGFPMIYTRVLTLRDLPPATYYLYLAAYNLVYVLPMALIVAAFVFTLGSYRLTEYQGRVLKLLSGLMMLGLGVVLLVRPEWLTHVTGAVALLALAAAGTAAVVAWDRWRRSPTPAAGPGRAGAERTTVARGQSPAGV